MDLKLGYLTSNRSFSKSMVRFRPWIKFMEDSVKTWDTKSLPFDILQISFVDKTEGLVDVIGPRTGDRLCQACTAASKPSDVDCDNRPAFVREVARRVVPVFEAVGIPAEASRLLSETVLSAGRKAIELGESLGPEIDSPESAWPPPPLSWK